MDHLTAGKQAENMACQFLQEKGLMHKESNYRCKQGEIDLVMMDGKTLVFVEVRYRKSSLFGTAAETIDTRKQHKLILTAQHYLSARGKHHSASRFDVISMQGSIKSVHIEWIQHAFIS
jgi:putative endonuclease